MLLVVAMLRGAGDSVAKSQKAPSGEAAKNGASEASTAASKSGTYHLTA